MKKKKVLIIALVIILVFASLILFLNNIFLPKKLKVILTQALEGQTHKKVSIGSLNFSIFSGLVLKGLNIYDDKGPIISLKEASCAFVIPALFQKSIIIPSLKVDQLYVYLERRSDKSLNLEELFLRPQDNRKKNDFSFSLLKVIAKNSKLKFQDTSLTPAFSKEIEAIDLKLYLSLPAKIKFDFKAVSPGKTLTSINAGGSYNIAKKELAALIQILNLSPADLAAYYQGYGVSIASGVIDSDIVLRFKENTLLLDSDSRIKDLHLAKDKLKANIDSALKANLKYSLSNKQLQFDGKALISRGSLAGIEGIGEIQEINTEVIFNPSGIFAQKISASLWGLSLQGKFSLTEFANPLFKVEVSAPLDLTMAQGVLSDKLKINLPGIITGEGNLALNIQSRPSAGLLGFGMDGFLDLKESSFRWDKAKAGLEKVSGRLEFGIDKLKWPEMNFVYLGLPYKSRGSLNNFKTPQVQLELVSENLNLDCNFIITDKLIKFSKCSGKYLNSEFAFEGNLGLKDPLHPQLQADGGLNIDLEDLKLLLPKAKAGLERVNPQGLLHTQCSLSGDIFDWKSCAAQAKFTSPAVSCYGLKATDFFLNYNQAQGVGEISLLGFSLYSGSAQMVAKMDLHKQGLLFASAFELKGVNIEELKNDTPAKAHDISGTLNLAAKINGSLIDLSKLSGSGKIGITNGKLWELDLFKGLGKLIFASDFAQVSFSEGSCDFLIRDQVVSTDNLLLKSSVTNLAGSVSIGFKGSLNAELNVEVNEELIPISGTFKDITSIILGKAGRVGTIKLSGTLKEPKYDFQAAVVNIFRGIKEIIMGK